MFRRAEDIYPEPIRSELLRLARLDPSWVQWHRIPDEPGKDTNCYTTSAHQQTWLKQTWQSGADAFAMWSASLWLADGPKVFRPTLGQCVALEQIEVRLELSEYSQPYPALLVDLPKQLYHPFTSILCHHSPSLLVCVVHSEDHLNDITTTVAIDGRPIELSLQRFDESLADLGALCGKALRCAVNACLALVNSGCHTRYLYPKERESDGRLAREATPRGQRARDRLQTAPMLVAFEREVRLYKAEGGGDITEPSGREMGAHWRRGHWHTVHYGVGKCERKRVLYPPILVRADKFLGDKGDTTTIYKT